MTILELRNELDKLMNLKEPLRPVDGWVEVKVPVVDADGYLTGDLNPIHSLQRSSCEGEPVIILSDEVAK